MCRFSECQWKITILKHKLSSDIKYFEDHVVVSEKTNLLHFVERIQLLLCIWLFPQTVH